MTFALLCAMTQGSRAQQVNYSVGGTCAGNGQTVYLIDRLTGKAVDSVVVAAGQFAFSGTAARDAYLAVRAGAKGWQTEFFNDGTPVTININDSTLKGSPQNERLARYNVEADIPARAFRAKTAAMTEAEMGARQEELMAEYNKVLTGQTDLANRVFREERHTLIPLAFAQLYLFDNGLEAYDELLAEQTPFATHPYLKKAKDDIAAMMPPQDSANTAFIGQHYTDLRMAAPDGTTHSIGELVGQGHWVLVDFWASWCGPCRAEMPNVVQAYDKYHAKGLEVVGVSFDQKKEAWLKAIEQLQMPWLQISDLKGWQCAAAPLYKINSIPDNILIDPQGKIVARALRGSALQRRLEKIFE